MKSRGLMLFAGIMISFFMILTGCGSSGSGSSDTFSSKVQLSGTASKGIINNGQAKAYGINNDGTKGAELGSDLTDANGQYSIDIGDFSGPVLIEVVGGTYIDEATGLIVDNIKLRAVIPPANGNRDVAVTPLTDMAVQIAGATLTVSQINNANAAVAVLIGGTDVTATMPPDINGDLSSATDEEINYTMVLAAVSQMVEDGDATDIADVVTMMSDDFADDGSLTFSADGTAAGSVIQEALTTFVASPENTTGLTEDNITVDEAIASAAKPVISVENWDNNGNGTVDTINYYTYDMGGNRVLEEQDALADSSIDSTVTNMYMTTGTLIMKYEDFNNDGITYLETIYNYNASWLLTSETMSTQPDNTPVGGMAYTYDASGNMTVRDLDDTGDGVPETRETFTYDVNGNMIMMEFDSNVDGTPEQRNTYSYDASGNMIMDEFDSNADDSVDQRFTYTYDDAGNMLMQEKDLNLTVVGIDEIYTFTYDAAGNLILEERNLNPTVGVIDEIYTWTYDADGNMTSYEADFDADGAAEIIKTYTWVPYTLVQ